MTNILWITETVAAVLLVVLILLHSPKGDGIGGIGGASHVFASQKSAEKGLNKLTNLFVPYELDMMKSIKDVDAPVVILSPSEDKLISLEQTTQLSKNIKNLSDFVILSKTPHNLTTSSCESIVKYLD